MNLRCPHRMFGKVTKPPISDPVEIEVACPSRWCGKRPGVTVLHVFSINTGELLDTRRFQSPQGRENNATGK